MQRYAWLVSALSAAAGFYCLRLYIHRFEQDATGGPPSEVLALAKDAPAGTRLSRGLLMTRVLPQAYLESRHVPVRELPRVLDARLGVSVRAGETLLFTDLASLRETPQALAPLVPEGMRAITLELHDAGAEGLLRPGDRVDVMHVAAARGLGADTGTSAYVASNLLVLAVGDDLGSAEPSARAARSGRLTLCVTPHEGLRLAQAEHDGALRVVVRNPEEPAVDAVADEPATSARAPSLPDARVRN